MTKVRMGSGFVNDGSGIQIFVIWAFMHNVALKRGTIDVIPIF